MEIEKVIVSSSSRKLRGEWTSFITPSRWNWSYYLGWFLLPHRKGIKGFFDRFRENLANLGKVAYKKRLESFEIDNPDLNNR
jgi:hypothetical protein